MLLSLSTSLYLSDPFTFEGVILAVLDLVLTIKESVGVLKFYRIVENTGLSIEVMKLFQTERYVVNN